MLNASSGVKVLAVDDEAFNLDIMTEYLTLAGYEVIPAEDGNSALNQLMANPDIAVIILDRMMPGMDGLEVLKKIKSKPQFAEIPVIIQTALGSPGHKFEAVDIGVFRYLSKPYEDHILINMVGEALDFFQNKKAKEQ